MAGIRSRLALVGVAFLVAVFAASSADLAPVKVERQPFAAQVKRLVAALEFIGAPLPAEDQQKLDAALKGNDDGAAVAAIQKVLDKHCLAGVKITGQSGSPKLEITAGPATPELAEQGWRAFLIKVDNQANAKNVELVPQSPNAAPLVRRSRGSPAPTVESLGDVKNRFLDLESFASQPLLRDLSGLELEYRILQVYCRDAGRKEASLGFGLQQGKKTVASSPPIQVLFDSQPAVRVKFDVKDFDGKPTIGAFTIKDARGRVYPSMSRRLAPDFFFHQQIYRKDGESVLLQPGKYTVSYARGPEYLVLTKQIDVPNAATHEESFQLKRWIHPARKGWFSGDHHIHAAGCSHYESPTEGVTPSDMMRHVLGEDLNVGCCLSWGPCWYHQKRYFEGKVHELSTPDHILRYDVEVSGFPSSHAGHICLLRLREQDYPGAKLIEDWPSWDLPIFRWAKSQGAVIGFAHSGWGLQPVDLRDPSANTLPNYLLPQMNGIGANEYLVDVAHNLCDFISAVDTPSVWELNIWYHTLNCGYRAKISGETDFPCIYGERVGLGRSYVHLDGKLDFDRWCEGIKDGRSYVSDGRSHLMDFTVNGQPVGLKKGEVQLAKAGKVKVTAKVAAFLEPKPTDL
ncbi:MAG: CehA/McbA family metallohydrolase, partial [Gemmataceae bacterium]